MNDLHKNKLLSKTVIATVYSFLQIKKNKKSIKMFKKMFSKFTIIKITNMVNKSNIIKNWFPSA